MTFTRAINLGIGVIVCVVVTLAYLFEGATRKIVDKIDDISLHHNVASRELHEMDRLILRLGHDFRTFEHHERIPPDVFLQFLDRLEARVAKVSEAEPAVSERIANLTAAVEAARRQWLDFFVRTPLLAFTNEALDNTLKRTQQHLLKARDTLIDIAKDPELEVPREDIERVARVLSQSENVLDRYSEFPDTLIPPIMAAVGRLKELIASDALASTSQPRSSVRKRAEEAVGAFGQSVLLIADERGSSLTSTAEQLAEVAVNNHQRMVRTLRVLQKEVALQIDQHHQHTVRDIQAARALSLNGVLICLLLGVVFAIGLRRYLRARISTMSSGVRAFSQGRLEERVPVDADDEIGMIAKAFNHMADSLQLRERERADHLEKLDRARRSAEEANAAKSKFLAAMSHEIRTPMNGVLGMTDLLSMEELTARQRGFVENIHSSGETLLTVINDILDFSKIEAGRLDLESAEFNLRKTVENVGQLLAASAHDKGLEIAVVIDHALADQRIGDEARLRQVLINLAGNAIKFTNQGLITIRVSGDGTGQLRERVRFEVTDTGVGISTEAQQQIFKPFAQVRGAVRGTSGTGLGLPISRNLVAMMGGRIEVDSQIGSGATFSFDIALPIVSPHATPAVPDIVAGIEVLVVSELAATREGLVQPLVRFGVAHAACASGREALDLLRQRNRDLTTVVLVDGRLSDMSAIEFARALRSEKDGSDTSKVALCMVGEEAMMTPLWHAAEIRRHLTKPVTQSMLFDCLSEIGADHPAGDASASTEPQRHDGTVLPRFAARILVAEDHPVNLQVVVQMLKILGCEVVTADNGAAAIELVHREAFDMVLMDCDMPVMNGFEATAQLRLAERETGRRKSVIVALTANALQGDRERCLNAGMDDYISKPFTTGQLVAVLARHLPPGAMTTVESSDSSAPAVAADVVPGGPDGELGMEPILDAGLLESIAGAGVEFVRSLLDKFVENWLLDRDKLIAAIDAGDREGVRKSAHRMKSSSANIGAKRLSVCCAEIENAARGGHLESLHDPIERLDATYDKTIDAFDERRLRVA